VFGRKLNRLKLAGVKFNLGGTLVCRWEKRNERVHREGKEWSLFKNHEIGDRGDPAKGFLGKK